MFEVLRERNQLDLNSGSNAIDNINVAILPTLVCHLASKGSISELASMYDGSSETKERKISPDIADYDGRTGLHLACANNKLETAKFFIEDLHADINFKDNFGRTALYEAVESKADDELITYLISRGAKLEMSKNAAAGKLCSLVEENNLEMLRKWVSGGIDVNAGDYDKRTALHIAAACGAVEILRFLLESGADCSLVDRFGNTAKQEAMREKQIEAAELL